MPPRPRARSWRWSTLLAESWRSGLAYAAGLLPAAVVALVGRGRAGSLVHLTDVVFVAMAGYLCAYVVLTVLAFTRCSWAEVDAWAHRRERSNTVGRLLGTTRPGPLVATSVSLVALVVGVVWLPVQIDTGAGLLPQGVAVALAVLLLVSAWLTVAVTYAVAYLLHDVRSGHRALGFPGEDPRSWEDYAYLALSTSTTFGTTDVEVRRTSTRRLVAGHAVLAFVFNTVVLAGVVSTLVTLQRTGI